MFFSNSTVRGGAEEHILTLLRQLDRNIFRLHLTCPRECAEKLQPDLPPDVELFQLSLQKPYDAAPARKFAAILRSKNIGILHSHMFGASLAASPIGRWCGVPVVIETPHIREAWRHGFFKGSFLVDRLVSRCVDHYIAVSRSNGEYLRTTKGLPGEKIHVIQNGCDLEKFATPRLPPDGLKESLGLSSQDRVLLVLARLEPQKGHRFLIDAMPAAKKELPFAKVVCVGEGALRGELTKRVADLNLGDTVYFAGYQSNIQDWLALADCTILPSLFEGLPLVAIESLAAQRTMIATEVDGTSEVIINEKTGLTVPPAQPEALSKAIIRLLRDDALRTRLAENGRQWVLDHFTQERQVRKTEELYMSAWDSPTSVARRNRRSPSEND